MQDIFPGFPIRKKPEHNSIMPKKPVFEIAAQDFRATVIDEKATHEFIQRKLSEKKVTREEAELLLVKLDGFLKGAYVGAHHTVAGRTFTAIVTKAPR